MIAPTIEGQLWANTDTENEHDSSTCMETAACSRAARVDGGLAHGEKQLERIDRAQPVTRLLDAEGALFQPFFQPREPEMRYV